MMDQKKSTARKPPAASTGEKANVSAPPKKKALTTQGLRQASLMDQIFDKLAVMTPKGKPDKEYKPKPTPVVSEEEENDFNDMVEDSTPKSGQGGCKCRAIVLEGEEDEAVKKRKKPLLAPPPNVTVIEINDKSDNEPHNGAKMYVEMYETVKDELVNVKSEITTSEDRWMTRSMMFTFAGTISSWTTADWEVIECAIDSWALEWEELRLVLLTNEQWKALESLGNMLEVTLHISHSKTPTLPWVLPMYEHMLKHLRTCKTNEELPMPHCIAAVAGLEKLETYYLKARQCQLNVIATMLPAHGFTLGPIHCPKADISHSL
ncbi:hypothetical protein B0H10DRAFT_2270506 [Mycena sp. CBHHK59/15]|nr:hypothetical protein B0H10DRAFT_2270506 [Mycena sp. CBHHK59/15]